MNIYERELLVHKFASSCQCVIYITVHRSSIIVLCHFERRVFVAVRHHLTTIRHLFCTKRGTILAR